MEDDKKELNQNPYQTPADLEARFQAHQEKIAELEKQLGVLKGVPTDKEPVHTIPKDTVSVGGKKYKAQILAFSHHKHGKVFTDEAVHDPDLIADIVAIPGQSIFKEVK